MTEKTAKHNPLEDRIPSEARQHARAAREELRESIRAFLPPEFMEHGRKARKEMLLAWRSVIDSALQRIEEREKEST
jgi:hypothetical protein